MTDNRMSSATIHESQKIADTLCNGCLCLEVLIERRRYDEREKYWCSKNRCYVLPKAMKECRSRCMKTPKVDARVNFNRGLKKL
jgi:hypothetical protein